MLFFIKITLLFSTCFLFSKPYKNETKKNTRNMRAQEMFKYFEKEKKKKNFVFSDVKKEFGTIPKPTGPYQVGVKAFDLIDKNRKSFKNPNGKLIPIWVYFPTKKGPHQPHKKVLEERALDLFDSIKGWKNLKIKVFSKHQKNLNHLKDKSCPVIFFNHGNSCLMTDYAFLLEDLASHGYIVVTITHQLKNDEDIAKSNGRLGYKNTNVIENCLFTFEWLKKNNKKIFKNSLNLKKIGVIGHSMGANASLEWAQKVGCNLNTKNSPETLFIHKNKKGVKECIISLDARGSKYPSHSYIPILMLMGEERKEKQIKNGEYEEMKKIGHKFIYYKNAHHGSFIDHAYINFFHPLTPNYKWFDGTTKERIKFFNKVRKDIRTFLKDVFDLKKGVFMKEKNKDKKLTKNLPVIAFDWGDTLFEVYYDPLHNFLKDSFSIDSLKLDTLLKDLRKSRKLKTSEKDFFTNYASKKNIKLSKSWFELLERSKLSCLKTIPKMMDLVKHLKDKGFKIILFSNIKKNKANTLQKHGYYDIFDNVILSCDIDHEKPNPKAYDILLEKIKVSPNNLIFIDNEKENIKIAKSKNIKGILFTSFEDLQKNLKNHDININL